MATLPRELLKWIQGLDLSYSIKNVKRDFANGFLFAEVLSRFYAEVDMHSFSNGTGMVSKSDNWFQLKRLFDRLGFPYDENAIQDIIHARPGAANGFLEQLYTTLTDRKLTKVSVPVQNLKVPPFARDTASHMVKQTLKKPSMLGLKDVKLREESILSALDEHKHKRQEDRKEFRESASIASSGANSDSFSGSVGRQRGIPQDAVSPASIRLGTSTFEGVTVKEVQVKQINKEVSSVRARKEFAGASPLNLSIYSARGGASDKNDNNNSAQGILQLMDGVARELVPSSEGIYGLLSILESDLEKSTSSCLDQMYNSDCTSRGLLETISDSDAAMVFEEIGVRLQHYDQRTNLGSFWAVANIFSSVLDMIPEDCETFEACQEAFIQYGTMLLRQVDLHEIVPNKQVILDMIFECGATQLLPIVSDFPAKRRAVLMVLCSFTEPDVSSRTYMIKRLHEHLDNLAPFLHCLTILVFMEENLSSSGPGVALLDLYAYYTIIGITVSSPSLRAASLAMLAVIIQHDISAVPRVLPKLDCLVDDQWWEVQCQLIIVCSKILDELQCGDGNHFAQTMDIILRVFHSEASITIQQVGLAYLGHHVHASERLLDTYLSVLLQMTKTSHVCGPEHEYSMEKLLGIDVEMSEVLPVQSTCGGVYHLPPLSSNWDSITIARGLSSEISSQRAENLEVWHFHIINALVHSLDLQPEEEGKQQEEKVSSAVEEIYETFKDYVFIGTCDPVSAPIVHETLRFWIVENRLPVFQEKTFVGSLRLLFGQTGSSDLQQAMGNLLHDLMSGNYQAHELIVELCTTYPELLQNEIICALESSK